MEDCGEHLMRAWLLTGYVTLTWPRGASLQELLGAKEMVNLQLDAFIRIAQREENARIEYESWFPPFDAEYAGHEAMTPRGPNSVRRMQC